MSDVTLTEFLLARIDADERAAREATAGESGVWVDSLAETGDGENIFFTVTDEQRLDDDYGYFVDLTARYGKGGRERAEHIARHDPARVLAECESKRRVVALHSRGHECPHSEDGGHADWYGEGDERWPDCQTLRLLALPYANHPDYDKAWRP